MNAFSGLLTIFLFKKKTVTVFPIEMFLVINKLNNLAYFQSFWFFLNKSTLCKSLIYEISSFLLHGYIRAQICYLKMINVIK